MSVPGPHRERLEMVREQIERRGVRDPLVLDVMRAVPREEFVSEHLRWRAHDDGPLPIGHGQTISQPYIVALMTELCALRGGERVLEVGTGSGYQAAVLAGIAARVFTIEIVEPLARAAAERLARLTNRNVICRFGDGGLGWPELAPFDAIVVTAAASRRVPPALVDQLIEGGRLVAPVGRSDQRLRLFKKSGGKLECHTEVPVRFVPLTGETER